MREAIKNKLRQFFTLLTLIRYTVCSLIQRNSYMFIYEPG